MVLHFLPVCYACRLRMDKYNSQALNAGTAQRDSQYFVTMVLNELTGLSEYTDTQIASMNLNHPSYYCNKKFWYVFVQSAHKRQLTKRLDQQIDDPYDNNSDESSTDSSSTDNSSDEDSSCDNETDSMDDDDDDSDELVQILREVEQDRCADTVVITKDNDGTRKASLATQEEHYEHRGEALKDYALIEWAAKIVVRKKPKAKTKKQLQKEQQQKAQRNPKNAGRPTNQRWNFRADYKFVKSHTSKPLTRLQRTYVESYYFVFHY